MFTSRVERTIAAAHSNGPPGQRCYNIHGHDWYIVIEVSYTELDEYGWGPDFGSIKKLIDSFDHQNLNDYLPRPSAEVFAKHLYARFVEMFRIKPDFVEVQEGNANSVKYVS